MVKLFESGFEVVFQLIHRFKEMIIEVFLFPDKVPQMFGGIKLRTVRRQQFYTDVGWLDQCFAFVPSGVVSKQHNIFLRVSLAESMQQFIHSSRIALRSN